MDGKEERNIQLKNYTITLESLKNPIGTGSFG